MKAIRPEQLRAGGWAVRAEAIRALGSGWPCSAARGWGPPKSDSCGIHGADTPSAVFMSSFFHIELHLTDRNTQPCQVAVRAPICKPL